MIKVRNKTLFIPESELSIAAAGDTDSAVRVFKLDRVCPDGIDLANLSFRLDLRYTDTNSTDTALVDKEVTDDEITLTWTVKSSTSRHLGTIFANIRAVNEDGNVRWASFQGAFYVESVIGGGTASKDQLTELEQLEERIDKKTSALDTSEAARVEAENGRVTAEEGRVSAETARVNGEIEREQAFDTAITDFNRDRQELKDYRNLSESYAHGNTGTRTGEDTDNAKYYAEKASASSASAKASEDIVTAIQVNIDNSVAAANEAATNAANVANTVQTKLDGGELKGEKGDRGDPGPTITDASDLTLNTVDTVATEYPEFNAGEEIHVFAGKVLKFLGDLKKKAETVSSDIKTLTAKVGDAVLTTNATDLSAAVNEVFGMAGNNAKSIETIDGFIEALKADGAARANALPFEHDLGTSFTAEQSADIRSGKFEKVRTGGYWTINGRKYWAAHADYRLHCGDTELTAHHMLVIPDKSFYDGVMNDTNVTTGGYNGSKMKTSGLANALATVKADFGADHILTHRILLTNAVSNGMGSGWAWYDSQIDLMNEHMVYGSYAWGGGSQNGHDAGADKSQLALFQARPDLICNRQNWWLRDVQSAPNFCGVNADGSANCWNASDSIGVRPAFLIY